MFYHSKVDKGVQGNTTSNDLGPAIRGLGLEEISTWLLTWLEVLVYRLRLGALGFRIFWGSGFWSTLSLRCFGFGFEDFGMV